MRHAEMQASLGICTPACGVQELGDILRKRDFALDTTSPLHLTSSCMQPDRAIVAKHCKLMAQVPEENGKWGRRKTPRR
jgi:hypothetical protein